MRVAHKLVAVKRTLAQFPDNIFPTPYAENGAAVIVTGITVSASGAGTVEFVERDGTTEIMRISTEAGQFKKFETPFLAKRGIGILLPFADIKVTIFHTSAV